ncbi:MAG: ATP-binding protein [Pseudomonadales bacterium]
MESNSNIDDIMYLERTLSKALKKTASSFPVILVTGPRQVGKTTLLEHSIGKGVSYVSLDSLADRELAQTDPALFIQRYPPPVIIDEVQYAPALFPNIKIEVDRRKKKGLFWLTGSQQFHLMKNLSETLAGRVAILQLQGLSQSEQDKRASFSLPFVPTADFATRAAKHHSPISLQQLYQRIWSGTFPAAVLEGIDHDLFYNSYLQTYIQRDVRDLAQVGNENTFLQFVRAVAARSGQLLNRADIARDVGVDNKTVKHWLSILETSGLIYLLQPYHTNLTKRLVKTPKLYFLDTGLCCFLTRWTSADTLEAGAMSGAIFETFVIGEIIKSYWHNARTGTFYFYRNKDQKEIDMLIEQDGQLYLIEIKKTANPDKGSVKNFATLRNHKLPVADGAILCMLEKHLPLDRDTLAIPVAYL